MTKIQHSTEIRAPRARVWAALADLGAVDRYHPGLRSSRYATPVKAGVGAARVCELKPRGVLEEQVTEWREGESYTIEVTRAEGVPPFRKAEATFRLTDRGPDRTHVTLDMEYQLGLGPIGALMDILMVRSQFTRTAAGILDGLRALTEGEAEIAA